MGAIFAVGAVDTLLAGLVIISWLGITATLAVVTLAYLGAALACFAMAGRGALGLPLLAGALALFLAGLSLAAPTPCARENRYFCIRSLDIPTAPDQPVRLMVIDHLGHGISAQTRRCPCACPMRISHILTDNGKEFTDRLFGLRKRAATGAHEFDRLCTDLNIETWSKP